MDRLPPDPAAPFVAVTVHKRDVFSETLSGHLEGAPGIRVVHRRLAGVPLWVRPVAWALARREIAGLRAVEGVPGTPQLVRVDGAGLVRTFSEGTPLNLARPAARAFWRDAHLLLSRLRRRGLAHNDLAKPQNWLISPEGTAAVIDFQLASHRPARGRLFRAMAYEDLRHLLKQKRNYAGHLLTPTERRVLERRSLPSRLWRTTGKRAYNFVTRRLMNWSDGEGAGARLREQAPRLAERLRTLDGVRDAVFCPYSLPARGVGLYGFVETELPPEALRAVVPEREAELLQPVAVLPRDAAGRVREDVLTLVAGNRLDEIEVLTADDPALAQCIAPILASRLNLTDRRLSGI
jgi:hypothetical protein